jgi:hypothetical protein
VTVCNLNQFRLSRVKNITEIEAILRDFSDDKRNKSDGSSFENSVDTQSKAFKEEFNNDVDDDGKDIDDDEISIDEGKVIEELVAKAASAVDEDELKNASHQFDDMILSCSWRGFDCLSG